MRLIILILLFIPLLSVCQTLQVNNNNLSITNGRTTQYIGKSNSNAGMATYDNRIIYQMCTYKLDSNSVAETSFFNDAGSVGSRTIPANVLKDGDVIRITTRSIFNSTGNPTNSIKIYFGDSTIVNSSATLATGNTTTYAEIQVDIHIEIDTDTTMMCMGRTFLVGGASRSLCTDFTGTGQKVKIDAANDFDITYTWGTADGDNWLRTIMATIQILN